MYAEGLADRTRLLLRRQLHRSRHQRRRKQYSRYLPGIASREDLNYLFREMLGKLSTGHTFVARR